MTESRPELPKPPPELDRWAYGYGYNNFYDIVRSYGAQCFAAGMDRAATLCAAEQAENRDLAKGSKTAMYDWMADGAGLCLGAIRAAIQKGA